MRKSDSVEKSGSVKKLTGALKKMFGAAKKSSSTGKEATSLAQLSPRALSVSTKRYAAGDPTPSPPIIVSANVDPLPTFLNTYNTVGVTVTPSSYAPTVNLLLGSNNLIGVFTDPNWFTIALSNSGQNVPLYGYNYYPGDVGTNGTTPVKWSQDPSGSGSQSLTNLEVHLISDLIKKPVKPDLNLLQRLMSNQLNSYLKPQITNWYTFLINNSGPGTDQYITGVSSKSYFENGTGWPDLQNGLDLWTIELTTWISGGYDVSNYSTLDTTDLGGPARGIPQFALGTPTLNLAPVVRPAGVTDYYTFFKGILADHSQLQNTNALLTKLGFQFNYNPSADIKMNFGSSLNNPIAFGSGKF